MDMCLKIFGDRELCLGVFVCTAFIGICFAGYVFSTLVFEREDGNYISIEGTAQPKSGAEGKNGCAHSVKACRSALAESERGFLEESTSGLGEPGIGCSLEEAEAMKGCGASTEREKTPCIGEYLTPSAAAESTCPPADTAPVVSDLQHTAFFCDHYGSNDFLKHKLEKTPADSRACGELLPSAFMEETAPPKGAECCIKPLYQSEKGLCSTAEKAPILESEFYMLKKNKDRHTYIQKNFWGSKTDFMSFVFGLGEGVNAKKEALRDIADHPEWYNFLDEFKVKYRPLVSQMLCFIEEHSPPEFDLECFDFAAGCLTSPFSPSGKVFLSLDSYFLEEERVRGLAAWECLELDEKMRSFSLALQCLFKVPEVFRDVLRLGQNKVFERIQSGVEAPASKKNLSECARPGQKALSAVSGLYPCLECLSSVAAGVVALQKESGCEKAAIQFKKKLEELKEHIDKVACIWDAGAQGIGLGPANSGYISMFRVLQMFYAGCPEVAEELQIEGKRLLLPKSVCTSTFQEDRKAGEMRYVQIEQGQADMRVGASGHTALFLQSVYYVDGEEQARRPVLIPQSPLKMYCAEIVQYIADLHGKPKDQIHVFSLSLSTRALTCRDPESTAYAGIDSSSSEILVFYYIPESTAADPNLRVVELRPSETKVSASGREAIYLPLFLSNLMYESIFMNAQEMYEKRGGACGHKVVESVHTLSNEVPHVFFLRNRKLQNYYPWTEICLDQTDTLGLDMCYAGFSATSSSSPGPEGCCTITYKSRSIEKEECHTVFIAASTYNLLEKRAGGVADGGTASPASVLFYTEKTYELHAPETGTKQYDPSYSMKLQEMYDMHGAKALKNLFWRVSRDAAGNAYLTPQGSLQCAHLGLRGRILQALMG
ncbi:uncharacterized protein NEMAJ01_2014 [Nematocida major]|uniref:uncharacterized protein n=1 Tax=Nematocida major TaxID=1912982 RepID=UPI002008A026|nr:uncharacterized protein NEMAJ01_2014 [Nematocida major]KAH9387118.1 hypothetical protein NEMAJ01_2014 [Nematocida major]